MKNILIPTDFSDASRDAFLYAQSFVQDSASFKVMHSYHPQMELAYPYLEALPESVSEKREGELYNFVKAFHPSAEGNVMIKNAVSSVLKIGLATDTIIKESEGDTDLIIIQYSIHLGLGIRDSLMKDLVEFTKLGVDEEVITKTKVNISYKVIGGLVSNQLIKLSKSEDTLMIVMGKTGKRVSINRLFGSVAREVSTKSFCPVLLVPQGKDYTVIDNILYASDYGAIDQFTLQKVVDFGERFKSAMHFVHVTDSKLDTKYKVIEEKIFDFLFQDNDPTFSFNLVNIKYPDVVTGLNKYIEENKIK